MKTKPFIGITLSTIVVVIGALVWHTPITTTNMLSTIAMKGLVFMVAA